MTESNHKTWNKKVAEYTKIMAAIKPGMNIFIGTGSAEPTTLVRHLMTTEMGNLQDLTLIQLLSFGDAISIEQLRTHRYRLKTFFSGWVANEAIAAGRVDLIPSRFSAIPHLIKNRRIPIDVAFIQISEPNQAGYCSLGIAVDVARHAIQQASIVVGEITPSVPRTFGDTFIPLSDFDYLVRTDEPPMYFCRWPVDNVFERVAANVAAVIDDGSCISFTIGPLFEALSRHLRNHRHLGIHTPFFTDALMDLVKSGAVSNRYKKTFRGKSLTSYAMGSSDLFQWLDLNPLVEFQAIDTVFNPMVIGKNPNFITIVHVRKVDLSGCIALHMGKGSVTAGPGQAMDFFNGAEISPGGSTIFALPSRNLQGEANIRLSLSTFPNQLNLPDSVDLVVTEYGIANLSGRSVRERAQALIEIAHPDDRSVLIDQAKDANILYKDQVFIDASAHLYPAEISARQTFKNDTTIRFRAIKPSDEEDMRRLFYRFSDQAVYYRYFTSIKTMPHKRMQEYVNIDFTQTLSLVGLAGGHDSEQIVAEARYAREASSKFADVAFVIDEEYQRLGIASFMYDMLIRLAKERGIKGFTADVLSTNKGMLKVFEKGGEKVNVQIDNDAYHLIIPFDG